MKIFSFKVREQSVGFRCSDSLNVHAEWLIEEALRPLLHRTGVTAGETIEVGWTVLKLRQIGDDIAVCEPDFRNDINGWNDDLTISLSVLAGQNDVVAKVGCPPVRCRFDDRLVVATALLATGRIDEQLVYLQRSAHESNRHDSGWYLGPVRNPKFNRNNPENFTSVLTCGLLKCGRPSLLSAMLLPRGMLVVFDQDEIVGVQDEQGNERWKR